MLPLLLKPLLSVGIMICSLSFFSCVKNPATPATGTIQGKVTNAAGDSLVAGVSVTTTPPTSAVSTDAQGTYIITGASPGEYTVTASKSEYNPDSVNITVVAGLATTANINLGVSKAPGIPTLILPLNGSNNQSTTITLKWSCIDLLGDSLAYDVYLGKTTPPTSIISTSQNSTSITRIGLDTSTKYYWKIVAKDNREGTSTIGPVWSFTTQSTPGLGTPETLAVQLGLLRPIVVRYVPAGTFGMGDTSNVYSFPSDTPVHQVTLSAFSIQETEVTQEQYLGVMGKNPAHFTGNLSLPVEQVSWFDAVYYCNALSKLSGLDTVYNTATWSADFTKKGIRLPTEAEYESACRGGTVTTFWWGADSNGIGLRAWSFYNSGNTTHPVATRLPNEYGLYDMMGNVWNWCNDWYGDYAPGAATDPIGPTTGTSRTLRGGTWYNSDLNLFRCAVRRYSNPSSINNDGGFRVVLPR